MIISTALRRRSCFGSPDGVALPWGRGALGSRCLAGRAVFGVKRFGGRAPGVVLLVLLRCFFGLCPMVLRMTTPPCAVLFLSRSWIELPGLVASAWCWTR